MYYNTTKHGLSETIEIAHWLGITLPSIYLGFELWSIPLSLMLVIFRGEKKEE